MERFDIQNSNLQANFMEERRNKTWVNGNLKERDNLEELEAGGRIT
jgi:hypothetical protein